MKEKKIFTVNQSLYLGLIQVLFLVVLYFSKKLFTNWDNISFLIALTFVYWSSIKYRDNYFGGFIRYSQVFSYGLKIMVLAGIIIGFFYFILLTADSEIKNQQIYIMLEKFQQLKYPDRMIEEMETLLLKNYPWIVFFTSIVNGFIMGIFVSLLTSIFVKKNDDSLVFSE